MQSLLRRSVLRILSLMFFLSICSCGALTGPGDEKLVLRPVMAEDGPALHQGVLPDNLLIKMNIRGLPPRQHSRAPVLYLYRDIAAPASRVLSWNDLQENREDCSPEVLSLAGKEGSGTALVCRNAPDFDQVVLIKAIDEEGRTFTATSWGQWMVNSDLRGINIGLH